MLCNYYCIVSVLENVKETEISISGIAAQEIMAQGWANDQQRVCVCVCVCVCARVHQTEAIF